MAALLFVPEAIHAEGGGSGRNDSKVSAGLASVLIRYQAHLQSAGEGAPFRSGIPAVRAANGLIVIDTVASGDSDDLLAELQSLGLQSGSAYGRVVSGLLPILAIQQLDGLASLRAAWPSYAVTSAGLVTSQGDAAMAADVARSIFSLDGSGVTVGTLSDSFDCLSGAVGDVASGDLPSGVTVLQEIASCDGAIDEGRAMMQIVHDVAPGATQVFHSAFNGLAGFANGIVDLAIVAGADVINDDIIYFTEPMFQDGIVAQAVDLVKSSGVSYFSSAGNSGRNAYESPYDAGGPVPVSLQGFAGYTIAHDFDPSAGVDSTQSFTIQNGGEITVVFQWDQPFFSAGGAGATSDYDLFFLDSDGALGAAGAILTFSAADNLAFGDAIEIMAFTNNTGAPVNLDLVVAEFDAGTPSPFGPYVKMVYFGSGFTVNEFATDSPTLFGHAAANGAEAIGAAPYFGTPAFGVSPPTLESFSSPGPSTIFFDTLGNALPSPEVRDKPEVVGPDGVNTTFFGGDFEPDGFPNFFGTSAAAPHVAGVAALIKQAEPSATPDMVYSALETTAIDMAGAGFDFDSGFGLVQADAAVAEVVSGVVPIPSITTWGLLAMVLVLGGATAYQLNPNPPKEGVGSVS